MLLRLQKILTQAGISSRRKAEQYILEGKVSVDGKVKRTLGTKADPFRNRICFKGKPIQLERKIYILLNKPKGYICTSKDTHNRATVFNLIKGIKERIFTIGRLDKDTEGLLLLTNDGEFANRLMHPSFKIDKTYKVRLDKVPAQKDVDKLSKGIEIEGKKTSPCKIKRTQPRQLCITIHEGRKRQVRKMLESVGYRVISLKRSEYGPLKLGSLKIGKYRYLSKAEVEVLAGKCTMRLSLFHYFISHDPF